MPTDIEELFEEQGLSLFPRKHDDLETDCSCPDWSNPCKHIAAVYYLLGEAFDRDPFLMFKLRGMEREALLAQLGEVAGDEEGWSLAEPEPLPEDPPAFWTLPPLPETVTGPLIAPTQSAALLQRLGPFPFWRGETSLLETLEPVYRAMGNGALAALGEAAEER